MAHAAEIVDFHVHYVGPAWRPQQWANNSDKRYQRIADRIADIDYVLSGVVAAGFSRKVLSAPPSLVGGAQALGTATIAAINDHLAQVVARYPDQLSGLATLDLWDTGAADEARRVHGLGFRGVVVDGAHMQSGAFANEPAILPVWRVLRDLGLVVFFHPVNLPGVIERFENTSRVGTLLGRGAVDAASLLALLDDPAHDELLGVPIVVPGIAAAALQLAPFAEGLLARLRAPQAGRGGVYFDTMGFAPANTRFLVDVLGAGRLVLGSDSPIVVSDPQGLDLLARLAEAGLAGAQLEQVAGGNAQRLLGLAP